MSDPKQTALDYLNNWRDAQTKIAELEATIAELKAVIAEALSNMEYYPASLGEMWLVQDKDITAMQEAALEKDDE